MSWRAPAMHSKHVQPLSEERSFRFAEERNVYKRNCEFNERTRTLRRGPMKADP
jgi:hypothetical protein